MMKSNKMKMIISIVLVGLLGLSVFGVAYASFMDRSKFEGATIKVGSADIKLVSNLALPADPPNLVDTMPGPLLNNVYPGFVLDYPVKVFNNTSGSLILTSNADYVTLNDPSELRQLIFVEILAWYDENQNGLVEADEIQSSFGRKSIVKWKTEGFSLGSINSYADMGLVFRFSADSIPDSKQGAIGTFDFEISSRNP